jgi:hypothetical protein
VSPIARREGRSYLLAYSLVRSAILNPFQWHSVFDTYVGSDETWTNVISLIEKLEISDIVNYQNETQCFRIINSPNTERLSKAAIATLDFWIPKDIPVSPPRTGGVIVSLISSSNQTESLNLSHGIPLDSVVSVDIPWASSDMHLLNIRWSIQVHSNFNEPATQKMERLNKELFSLLQKDNGRFGLAVALTDSQNNLLRGVKLLECTLNVGRLQTSVIGDSVVETVSGTCARILPVKELFR